MTYPLAPSIENCCYHFEDPELWDFSDEKDVFSLAQRVGEATRNPELFNYVYQLAEQFFKEEIGIDNPGQARIIMATCVEVNEYVMKLDNIFIHEPECIQMFGKPIMELIKESNKRFCD